MAQVSAFVGTTRNRITAYLKAMEDIVNLQAEFNALGGTSFTDTFDFGGENASSYDVTQAEFVSGLVAVGQIITAFQNGAVAANANRQRDLYKLKVS
jgi:hypothetical protein